METIFTENWEQRLEMQFLKNGRCRKRAYICSPLSAEKDVDFLRNMHSARGLSITRQPHPPICRYRLRK